MNLKIEVKGVSQAIKGVEQDLKDMLFNTCISKMMEFLNSFSALEKYPKSVLKMATIVLHPFAPHIAEECWQLLGGKNSIAFVPFPAIDESFLATQSVTFVVQVNGKVRGTLELQKDTSQELVLSEAKKDTKISGHVTGEVKKVIFIPNKLLNILC